MKTFVACAAVMFLAVGCVSEPPRPPSQDQAMVTPADDGPRTGDALAAGDAALIGAVPPPINCTNPPTCVAFCQCDRLDCIAAGSSPAVCNAEYTQCFHEICLR
jgi:hypothetical protein